MAVNALATARTATATRPRLHIMVLGLRGVIDVQGGIETHARRLYPLLARLGCDVEIVQRSAYYPRERRRRREWRRITLTYLWSSRTRIVETAVHTLLGVLYAGVKTPDVLHLHAIGPALLAPLARLFGLRVVVTHDCADYQREKWGSLAKAVLRVAERPRYFPVGDTQALARQLEVMTQDTAAAERRALHAAIHADYAWRQAAELTSSVYRYVARGGWQHG